MENKNVSESKQYEIICKNCGAKLSFEPGTDSLKCQFCGALNEIEIDETARAESIQEIDFEAYINGQVDTAPKIEITTVKCDGCGAETTFDPNVVSSECDFCGSPLVSKEAHTSQVIAPKSMLPFKVGKVEGNNLYKNWLRKLWFAPNNLKKQARQTEDLAGIYTPYWTYDSDTKTDYSGQRGDNYQTTETYNEGGQTKTRTVTKTRWTYVSGRVARFFDDVMVPASDTLPRKYVDRLEPWDLENLVPYDTKYLAGFKSETYHVGLPDGFSLAKEKMEPVIRTDIRRDIGGDHQQISSMNTLYYSTTFKHILLPIWLSAYKYNNKVYRFMINARTGEVQGERPWSWIKITLAVLAGIAIAAGLYWFFGVYQK
jgi:LSD1 subclass zinc finger protein